MLIKKVQSNPLKAATAYMTFMPTGSLWTKAIWTSTLPSIISATKNTVHTANASPTVWHAYRSTNAAESLSSVWTTASNLPFWSNAVWKPFRRHFLWNWPAQQHGMDTRFPAPIQMFYRLFYFRNRNVQSQPKGSPWNTNTERWFENISA